MGLGMLRKIPIVGDVLGGLTGEDTADAYGRMEKKALPKVEEYGQKVGALGGAQTTLGAATMGMGAGERDRFDTAAKAGRDPLEQFSASESNRVIGGGMKDSGAIGAAAQRATAAAAGNPSQAYYDAYRSQGPSRQLEDFYASSQAGNNPYYDRLSEKLAADSQRASMARGVFNSGRAQRLEGEAQADLRAQQYREMADMAAKAQELGIQSSLAGAQIAERATTANQAANELMVKAAMAQSDDERERYTALADVALKSDQLGLDWRKSLAEQSSQDAARSADIMSGYQAMGLNQYNRGIDTQTAGLTNTLEGILGAYGLAVEGAKAKQRGYQDLLGSGVALATGLNKKKG